jgi:hypothetical protein
MSPTVFIEGPYRFFFFSREELRMHVHVMSSQGEAKFWIEPEVCLAQSVGFKKNELNKIVEIIEARKNEIRNDWEKHFKS